MGKWRTEVRKGREGQLGTCQTWAIDPLRSRAQAAQPDPAMPVPPSLCLRQMTRPGDAPSLLDTLGRRSDPIITSVIIRGTSIVSTNIAQAVALSPVGLGGGEGNAFISCQARLTHQLRPRGTVDTSGTAAAWSWVLLVEGLKVTLSAQGWAASSRPYRLKICFSLAFWGDFRSLQRSWARPGGAFYVWATLAWDAPATGLWAHTLSSCDCGHGFLWPGHSPLLPNAIGFFFF